MDSAAHARRKCGVVNGDGRLFYLRAVAFFLFIIVQMDLAICAHDSSALETLIIEPSASKRLGGFDSPKSDAFDELDVHSPTPSQQINVTEDTTKTPNTTTTLSSPPLQQQQEASNRTLPVKHEETSGPSPASSQERYQFESTTSMPSVSPVMPILPTTEVTQQPSSSEISVSPTLFLSPTSMVPSTVQSTTLSVEVSREPSSTNENQSQSAAPSKSPSIVTPTSYSPRGSVSFYPSFELSLSPTTIEMGSSSVSPIGSASEVDKPQPPALSSGPPSTSPSELTSDMPSPHPSVASSESPSMFPTEAISGMPSSRPTVYPTVSPSMSPTEAPSKKPSETPSKSPSFKPSFSPSVIPTSYPSAQPSVSPSFYPSALPSLQPTLSGQPSKMPSSSPSLSPSGQPSHSSAPSFGPTTTTQPSDEPSISPSDAPSAIPSISQVPSSSPSGAPSSSPSEAPTLSHQPTESPVPSSSPTGTPSSSPSGAPSATPTISPSAYPTQSPSAAPSESPSKVPSGSPSSSPSSTPSATPSASPSSQPSSFPSSSPTLECHDHADYTSPINGLNCEQHRNTACTAWRALGLDLDEVQELVENCPVSCEIECGSFAQVDITFSFILSFVSEQLDVNAEQELEETSQQYFEAYVRTQIPGATFELDEVNLVQTDILSNRRLTLHERSLREIPDRSLVGIAQLRVHLSLIGFTINVTFDRVMELLTNAVDEPTFTTELQRSDPFFADANASSVPPVIPQNLLESGNDENRNSRSTATITVSTIGVTCFVLGVAFLLYHGRRTRGCHVPGIRQKPPPPLSPRVGSPNRDALNTNFDGSPNPSAVTTPHTTNGLLRMLSLSLSRSHDSTSSCSSANGTQTIRSVIYSDIDVGEEDDDEDEKNQNMEHPLAGIIPPMIVIDLEEDTEGKSASSIPSSKTSLCSGVPMKHVEASSELRAALRTPSQMHAKLSEMIYDTEAENLRTPKPLRRKYSGESVESSSSFFSTRSDDDESSIASTPVKYSEADVELGIRRTLSSSALDTIEPSDALDELIRSQWDDLGTTPTSRATSLPASPETKTPLDSATPLTTATMTPTRHSFAEAKTVRRGTHRVVRSGDAKEGMILVGHFPPVFANLSPIQKTSPQNKSQSSLTLPKLESSGASPTRKSRAGSFSSATMDDVASTNNSILSLNSASGMGSLSKKEKTRGTNEDRLSFEVPCSGKLGLIIESSSNMGPTIHTVKEYSPLHGLIGSGDRILKVDGEDTTNMSTGHVTRLLARRKSEKGNGMLKITVSRPAEIPPLPILVDSVETSPMRRKDRFLTSSKSIDIDRESYHFKNPSRSPSPNLPPKSDQQDPSSATQKDEEDEEDNFHFLGAHCDEDYDYEYESYLN